MKIYIVELLCMVVHFILSIFDSIDLLFDCIPMYHGIYVYRYIFLCISSAVYIIYQCAYVKEFNHVRQFGLPRESD